MAIINQLQQLAQDHPREGFWKSYYRLRNKSEKVKKRLPERVKEPLLIPIHFTHTWSIDVMHDVLTTGRTFRTFNGIDDYN